MKFLLTTLFILASTNAFALPSRDLDHMDLVDLTHSNAYSLDFTVQYPGLGGGQFNAQDCLALIVGKRFVSDKELKKFSKLVSLADGSGILFNGPHRDINILKPELVNLGRKRTLVYKLKDLGTYVTGVRMTNFTVYAGFRHAVESAFGKTDGTTAFQFLRGCKL